MNELLEVQKKAQKAEKVKYIISAIVGIIGSLLVLVSGEVTNGAGVILMIGCFVIGFLLQNLW